MPRPSPSPARRCSTLIGDILDFSKIESGMLTLDEDEVDLRILLSTAWPSCCARAPMPRASRCHRRGAATCRDVIRTDEVRLRQVLTNLIGNAVKFTEQGGVCVEVDIAGGRDALPALRSARHRRRRAARQAPGDFPGIRPGRFQPCAQIRRHGPGPCHLQAAGRSDGRRDRHRMRGAGRRLLFLVHPAAACRRPRRKRQRPAGQACASRSISRNAPLREGLHLQIAAAGGIAVEIGKGDQADAILIDAGTGNRPDLSSCPMPDIPVLVLLTPDCARPACRRSAPWALPAIWSSRCASPRW